MLLVLHVAALIWSPRVILTFAMQSRLAFSWPSPILAAQLPGMCHSASWSSISYRENSINSVNYEDSVYDLENLLFLRIFAFNIFALFLSLCSSKQLFFLSKHCQLLKQY